MRITFFVTCIVTCLTAFSQKITPIDVGQKVPAITFDKFIHGKRSATNLSDYKGKFVVLDFWSIFCSQCISSMPKMQRFQDQYQGRMQIIFVDTRDTKRPDGEQRAKSIIGKVERSMGKELTIPMAFTDTILERYFPHKTVPTLVWIDPNGTVIGITEWQYLTHENIESVLSGVVPKIPRKYEFDFEPATPLLTYGNGGEESRVVYRSLFTKYIPSAIYTYRYNDKREVTGICVPNTSLQGLTNHAYRILSSYPETQKIYDVDPDFKKTDTAHVYCYDLTIPATNPQDFYEKFKKYLQDDLKRYFNISVSEEKRKMNVLVVTDGGKLSSLASRYEKEDVDIDSQSIKNYFHNCQIEYILPHVALHLNKTLIDKTGMSDLKIDLDFPERFNWNDPGKLIAFLREKGFEIREEESEMPVAVIRNK